MHNLYHLKETDVNMPYALPSGEWIISSDAANGLTIQTKQKVPGNQTANIDMNSAVDWQVENYKTGLVINFELEGGTWTEENTKTFTFSDSASPANEQIPNAVPEKDGYIFAGWNENADGTGAMTYVPGDEVYSTTTSPVTLHAVWVEARYVARVIANDGTITYHEALIDNGNTTYNGQTIKQGAFDYANTLTGDVVIEMMKTAPGTGRTADDESVKYLVSANTFTFNKAGTTSLTLRTMKGLGFTSTIKKDKTNTLIATSANVQNLYVENMIFDGNAPTRTFNSAGGIFNIASPHAVFTDCDFQNLIFASSYSGYCGGGIYYNVRAGRLELYGCVFKNTEAYHGGGVYMVNQPNITLIVDASDTRRTQFIDCKARYHGGGILFDPYSNQATSKMTMKHTDFIRCSKDTRQ